MREKERIGFIAFGISQTRNYVAYAPCAYLHLTPDGAKLFANSELLRLRRRFAMRYYRIHQQHRRE